MYLTRSFELPVRTILVHKLCSTETMSFASLPIASVLLSLTPKWSISLGLTFSKAFKSEMTLKN